MKTAHLVIDEALLERFTGFRTALEASFKVELIPLAGEFTKKWKLIETGDAVIFCGTDAIFTPGELAEMQKRLDGQVRCLVLAPETTGFLANNLNHFLEPNGISLTGSMTTRVVYNQKHMDPLEALIDVDTIAEVSKLIYPFGTTLKIQAPSRPIVVTDSSTIPFQQPVMAVNDAKSLLVLGSCRCVDDGYLDQNSALIAVLVKWLASEYKFEQQCEVGEFEPMSNIIKLAQTPRFSFEDTEYLPRDVKGLFDFSLAALGPSPLEIARVTYEEYHTAQR